MIKKTYSFEKNGRTNEVYTFTNAQGAQVEIFTYGARLHRILVPDKKGKLGDILVGDRTSPIFTHHIDYINKSYYKRSVPYEQSEPNQIVVDYIAGMTDNYFIELHRHLFPESDYKVEYKGYFD